MNKTILNFAIFSSISYLSLEYSKYKSYTKIKERFQNILTPLSDNLDNEQWTSFFIQKIQLLQVEELQLLIEKIFCDVPLKYIEFFRMFDALMVIALGCEKIDIPNKFNEEKVKKYHDQINQVLLEFFKNKSKNNINNNKIISIQDVLQRLNKPFIRIDKFKINNVKSTSIFFSFPLQSFLHILE
jgi:hypothetical protein